MAKTNVYKDTYFANQTSDGLPELSGLNYDLLQIPIEQNSLATTLLQNVEHFTFSEAKPTQAPHILTETLLASIEHDTSGGAEASDTLHGSEAHDTLHGSDSDDTLGGGESHDTLHGADADDTLETEEAHADSVHSSEGHDHLESNPPAIPSGYTDPIEAGLIGVTHDADLNHTDFLI